MSITEIPITEQASPALSQVLSNFRDLRKISFVPVKDGSPAELPMPEHSLLKQLPYLSQILSAAKKEREADVLIEIHSLAQLSPELGGLGFSEDQELTVQEESQLQFLVLAWLESLNSADRGKKPQELLTSRPEGRRGMTLSEKIFAAHDIEQRGELKPGDMVRVDVDWVMASEISWSGMKKAYDGLGKPGIFRNDRFWLAGDHIVDPRIKDMDLVKKLVAESETARDDFHMTEYQGMNYTIMHTEFCRERAQPGMLIIGSDSHTCSAGSMGSLAIGLGVADVTIPLITGETWFKVPESVNIRLINEPSPGIGGKDVILYIMKELKRNTVAAERVVEYTGPGVKHLSCDARFAIANMTTEFGGVTGIFTPDQTTYDFISRRKSPRHKKDSRYFRPDEDATYVATHVIDLAKVESFVALYPSPDDVVPISQVEGKQLDGCFIGACTTAEEDLILAGMVLELGLKKGLKPIKEGKRKVVPGSLPILHKLRELGFVKIYEDAGFKVGIPGCSYCVGMGADRASAGEVWLSSQNRNFENRMGQGAIGNLASAVSVAASSFDMKITNPKTLLDEIDLDRYKRLLGHKVRDTAPSKGPSYVEPAGNSHMQLQDAPVTNQSPLNSSSEPRSSSPEANQPSDIIRGKVQRLGDFIDTDALAPAEILMQCKTDEEFGSHCLKHTHPEFRQRVKDGLDIVVAGSAFGCGSSRENAVNALMGAGVKCVIAKSFAFIYARNQPNLGLLGITITDPEFYDVATDAVDIEVDLTARKVVVDGREWTFQLSQMEKELIKAGGIRQAFEKFGKRLFEVMCVPASDGLASKIEKEVCDSAKGLQW